MSGAPVRVTAAVLLLGGCAPGGGGTVPALRPPPLPALSIRADSITRDSVAPGVLHYAVVRNAGPWRIQVLEADRAACWSLASIKAGEQAVGRIKTSELIENAERRTRARGTVVAGGVNGDFFSFAPPGVPAGASIHEGRVITGPGPRPVVASDSSGRAWIGTLAVWGRVVTGFDTIPLSSWNRASRNGVAFFDPSYGEMVDSATGSLRVSVGPGRRRLLVAVDSSGGPAVIPESGGVISAGPAAPATLRARLVAAVSGGQRFDVVVGLEPLHPREALGGFPVLVRDSIEAAELDSAGGATFGPVRHPRTLVGLGAAGRRIVLVSIDGRQPGYSVGMTLRESAQLMRELGVTQALNLDGGGSTAMVVRRRFENAVRFAVANKPSDKEGERPVANALVVISDAKRCLTR